MAFFQPAIDITLAYEGGYQNHPSDPGNYNSDGVLVGTNYGITPNVYEEYFGWVPTASAMQGLQKSQAQDIYKKNFWDYYDIGQINNQNVANQIFDLTVLHGNFKWIINNALNEYGISRSESDPLTPSVISDINAMKNPDKFNDLLVKYRKAYFDKIINDNPSLAVFRNGWITRADGFKLNGTKGTNILPLIAGGSLVYLLLIPRGIKKK